MPANPSHRERVAWALFLVVTCFVVYANGMTGTFNYDDKAIIRDNPRILAPAQVAEIFSTSYFGGPRGSGSAYRPVLLLSYAAQWWIHGRVPEAFHFVNVLCHAVATLLFGALLLRIGVRSATAALASLLFAVDPVHVEAVTSLVGRGETLAALFTLGFLHVALGLGSGRGSGSRGGAVFRWPGALLVSVLYALGILTKESAAVAPALYFLLLAYREPGRLAGRLAAALRRGWPVLAGATAALAGTLALRSWVLGGMLRAPGTGIFEVENALARLPAGARAINAGLILLRYAGRTLFPLHLSADESAWSIRPVPATSWLGLAAALLVAILAAAALARFSSGSPVALGVLFFGVAFLPTANVLYPIGTIFGERVAYLPSAGLCLALGAALAGSAETLSDLSPARRRAAAAVGILFAVRTVIRNPVWWSDSAIFASSVATSPGSSKAHYNQAYVWAERRRTEDALSEYEAAVKIYPDYWDAWAGKGKMERELERFPESEASYRRALQANSTYENGFFGLGLTLEEEDRLPEAAATYRRGLEKIPDSLPLAYRLAVVLSDLSVPEAGDAWKRALKLGARSSAVHADRADWLMDQGREGEAIAEARVALRLDPGSPSAWRVLARRAEAKGEPLSQALAIEKACRGSGDSDDLEALEALAEKNPQLRARLDRTRPLLEKAIERESH